MAEIKNLATTGDFETAVSDFSFKVKFTVNNNTKALTRLENGQIHTASGEWKGTFYTSEEATPQLYVNSVSIADQAAILPALSQTLTALTEALTAESAEE